jgi:hypothetical protein
MLREYKPFARMRFRARDEGGTSTAAGSIMRWHCCYTRNNARPIQAMLANERFEPMAAPKTNLTCVTPSSPGSGQVAFWLSEPEAIDTAEGTWGFAIYADQEVFLVTFTYPSQHAASRAREAMIPVLREATAIATAES